MLGKPLTDIREVKKPRIKREEEEKCPVERLGCQAGLNLSLKDGNLMIRLSDISNEISEKENVMKNKKQLKNKNKGNKGQQRKPKVIEEIKNQQDQQIINVLGKSDENGQNVDHNVEVANCEGEGNVLFPKLPLKTFQGTRNTLSKLPDSPDCHKLDARPRIRGEHHTRPKTVVESNLAEDLSSCSLLENGFNVDKPPTATALKNKVSKDDNFGRFAGFFSEKRTLYSMALTPLKSS